MPRVWPGLPADEEIEGAMIMRNMLSVCRLAGAVLFLAATSLGLAGCGHTIMGRVIEGDASKVELVHESEPRLRTAGAGVNNVEVSIRRDPNSASKQLAGRKRTEATGDFMLGVGGAGAGWLDEQWLLQTYASGYQSTNQLIELPPKSRKWRLLITIPRGTAEPVDDMDQIMREVEQFQ